MVDITGRVDIAAKKEQGQAFTTVAGVYDILSNIRLCGINLTTRRMLWQSCLTFV